jgi:deoxyadenosine/deoxycytidine kinase
LQTQLAFLLARQRQQRSLALTAAGRGVVADYLFAKDRIFAEMNLQGDELGLYREVLGLLAEPVPVPDLVIYLEARPEVLLRRLRKRNRDFERRITPQYLEGLIEAYRSFFHEYAEAPLLVVNCSAIDFVEQGSDLADLIREIRGVKQGVQHYIPLGSQ